MCKGEGPYPALAPFQVRALCNEERLGWRLPGVRVAAGAVPQEGPQGARREARSHPAPQPSNTTPKCVPSLPLHHRLFIFALQVVGKKLEEIHKKTRLLLPPCMPPDLRRLVWDCTNWDPAQRWAPGRGAASPAHPRCCLPMLPAHGACSPRAAAAVAAAADK